MSIVLGIDAAWTAGQPSGVALLRARGRRRALLAQWTKLRRALAESIAGGTLRVPSAGPLAALKRYEDALDALICAWTGAEYLAGRLRAYGDASAAVWAH